MDLIDLPPLDPNHTLGARPARQSRRRRGAFLLAVLLVLAVIQEILFRSLFCVPEVEGFNRLRYQMMAGTHPDLPAALKQGLVYDRLRFESDLDGFSELHSLNLYGFRTADFTIEPAPGRRRILLLGDSVVEGQGAPDSATIAASWKRELARDGVRAEVINLGVVAATVDRLTRLARDAVPLLRPTDVVLVLYANDLPAPPIPPDLLGDAPRFPRRNLPAWTPRAVELLARAARGAPIHRRWPQRVIPFFPAVPSPRNPWTNRQGPPAGLDPAIYQSMRAGRINPWLTEQAEALPGMLAHDFSTGGMPTAYLRRIAEICRQEKANLLVAYVPFHAVVSARYAPALKRLGMDSRVADALASDPSYRRQNVMLEGLCGVLDLPFCDTTEALAAAEAAGTPQFWSYDSHPRPAGYATIARAIHRAWRRSAGSGDAASRRAAP